MLCVRVCLTKISHCQKSPCPFWKFLFSDFVFPTFFPCFWLSQHLYRSCSCPSTFWSNTCESSDVNINQSACPRCRCPLPLIDNKKKEKTMSLTRILEYHTVLCTATRFSLFCRRKKLESADFELRWEQLNILSQLKQECQSESVRHPELPLESGYVCSNFISRIVQWRAWVIRPLMNWPIHKRGCVDRDRYDAMQICPICGFYFLHRRKRWRMIESRPERRDTGSVDYFELLNPVLAGNWNLP